MSIRIFFFIRTIRACIADAYHSYYLVHQAMVVLIQGCPFRVIVSSLLKISDRCQSRNVYETVANTYSAVAKIDDW